MRFVLRMLISAAALFGVAYLSGGALLQVDRFWPAAVIAALVLAVVNATIKPIVSVLSIPVTFLTLGLFGLVINALMLYIVSWIVPGVHTTGFLQTVVASIVISIVTALGGKMLEDGNS
ncbi:MAG: phage holin family protein [Coriobacteriales bacterium]|nr:phage holin family protein [Actinomycetes bacterium]